MRRQNLNTESVRQLFQRYGYTITNPAFQYHNQNQNIRVRNDLTYATENWNVRQLRYRINRGRLVEIDPFLHTVLYGDVHEVYQDRGRDHAANFARKIDMNEFINENANVQNTAYHTRDILIRNINRNQNAFIVSSDDGDVNKGRLYGLIYTLYAVSHMIFRRRRMAVAITDSITGEENYFALNINTIDMLKELVRFMIFGDNRAIDSFTESEHNILFSLNAWEKIEIVSVELAPREQDLNDLDMPAQRRRGGVFPFINLTNIDLSRYGIYNSFNIENYSNTCLIQCLKESDKIDEYTLEHIMYCINTKMFPCDKINKICELANIHITVSYYDEAKHKITNTKTYGDNLSTDTNISLLLRHNHYMLNEAVPVSDEIKQLYQKSRNKEYESDTMRLNVLLSLMFENKCFKRISSNDIFKAIRHSSLDINEIDDLTYDEASARPASRTPIYNSGVVKYEEDLTKYLHYPNVKINRYRNTITSITLPNGETIKNIKLIINNDIDLRTLHKFRELLLEHFGIDVFNYTTLSQLGHEIMFKYNCFDDVCELTSKPAQFIKKCSPKVLLNTAYDKPVYAEGDLIQIDKNGSYTSTYMNFEGIPKGKPKVIQTFEPDKYCYYFIKINIKSYTSKHNTDAFPLIKQTGIMYLDKTMLDAINEHYNVEYDFICGYYFDEGFNDNIKKLAGDLYQLRDELKQQNSTLEKSVKQILNSLWGKCISKKVITRDYYKNKQQSKDFEEFNLDYIYKYKKLTDDLTAYTCLKPFNEHYTIPQFSVYVLSYSRIFMNDIIYKAADADIPIYYSNTDSLVFDKSNIVHFNDLMGSELGKFKIEHDNIKKLIILSPKIYLRVYENKEYETSSFYKNKDNIETYFENLYKERI